MLHCHGDPLVGVNVFLVSSVVPSSSIVTLGGEDYIFTEMSTHVRCYINHIIIIFIDLNLQIHCIHSMHICLKVAHNLISNFMLHANQFFLAFLVPRLRNC